MLMSWNVSGTTSRPNVDLCFGSVIPAQAGNQRIGNARHSKLGSRLRGNDEDVIIYISNREIVPNA